MTEEQERRSRAGWGLPPAGTAAAPGGSWEGEGRQPRPEPAARGRRGRSLLVVAVGVLLGGGAVLLAGLGEPDAADTPERLRRDTAEVAPGACLATLSAEAGDDLDLIDCAEQHLGEVVAVVELQDEDYPGEAVLAASALGVCASAFADYVGTPVGDTELGLLPVVPDEADWRVEGDRTVVCVAEGPALVGSVRAGG